MSIDYEMWRHVDPDPHGENGAWYGVVLFLCIVLGLLGLVAGLN